MPLALTNALTAAIACQEHSSQQLSRVLPCASCGTVARRSSGEPIARRREAASRLASQRRLTQPRSRQYGSQPRSSFSGSALSSYGSEPITVTWPVYSGPLPSPPAQS